MLRHKSIKKYTKFGFHRNVYQEIYRIRVSQKCLSRNILKSIKINTFAIPAVFREKLLISKDQSRKIAIKLIYYLMVAKSSGRDYKYFKSKIVIIIYLHERVSTRVLRTWWVKVPRKNKRSKIKRKKE